MDKATRTVVACVAALLAALPAEAAFASAPPSSQHTAQAAPSSQLNPYRDGYRQGYQDGFSLACKGIRRHGRPYSADARWAKGYSDGFTAGYTSGSRRCKKREQKPPGNVSFARYAAQVRRGLSEIVPPLSSREQSVIRSGLLCLQDLAAKRPPQNSVSCGSYVVGVIRLGISPPTAE